MIKTKKLIAGLSVFASVLAFSQSASYAGHYPQMYENQASAATANTVSEKSLLTSKEQIDISINSLLSDPVLRSATWGFVIYDPQTKKIINSYNENLPLVPASTTKLLTTDTAMSLLGSKFRWTTQLDYSGTVTDGVLNGNLYIISSGDPSLGTNKAGAGGYSGVASEFVSSIAAAGITKVQGDIIVETAVFVNNKKDLPKNIVWKEQGNYYLPVGNTVNINPQNEQVTVKAINPFSKENRYFYVSPYTNKMAFASKYDGTTAVVTKLPDAPVYLANTLRTSLLKSGIFVAGKVIPRTVEIAPEDREKLAVYQSPTLAEIITYTNKNSDNALAEALLRMVGFQKDGDQTLESGRRVVTDHLAQQGFDVSSLNYIDGSGLSHNHRVTPISQAKFLANLMNANYYRDFFESLPVGGQDGTLKKMFFGDAYGQIFAKTGTLNKVKCLAGYIKTRTGKTLTFSLLVNNYAGSVDMVKSRMERLLDPAINL